MPGANCQPERKELGSDKYHSVRCWTHIYINGKKREAAIDSYTDIYINGKKKKGEAAIDTYTHMKMEKKERHDNR